jgi:hypothetical protein
MMDVSCCAGCCHRRSKGYRRNKSEAVTELVSIVERCCLSYFTFIELLM